MMGVVMVSASFYPYIGGAEKQALELSAALRRRGLDVVVVTRRLRGLAASEEVQGVPVRRLFCLAGGLLNAASFMISLSWFLWRRRACYDIVHVHLAGSPALAAAIMGRALRKPVYIKLGGGPGIGELAASARTWSGRLKLKLLSRLDPKLLAVAKELAVEARRYLGPVSVHVLANGVDTQRYKPAPMEQRLRARRRLGWPEHAFVFLYVGRLSPEKRLPQFVEHWVEAVRRSKTAALFVAIGQGAERAPIETAAAYWRARDQVRVMEPIADIESAYAAADVFVLPSVSEGLSNALLEAMSSGLAVLASRVGGTPEVVEDGTSGFLFPPGDWEALKAQLDKLLERPELSLVMGPAARKVALEKYALDKVAERCETIYRFGA